MITRYIYGKKIAILEEGEFNPYVITNPFLDLIEIPLYNKDLKILFEQTLRKGKQIALVDILEDQENKHLIYRIVDPIKEELQDFIHVVYDKKNGEVKDFWMDESYFPIKL